MKIPIDIKHLNMDKSTPFLSQPVQPAPSTLPYPSHIRYNTTDGHRLPLKHSYKHQSVGIPERVRNVETQRQQVQITDVKDRVRSSSCPPSAQKYDQFRISSISSNSAGVLSALDQKGLISKTNKYLIDAGKETWAMHHAVMTSKIPDDGKTVLPSFSTFSSKTQIRHDDTAASVVDDTVMGSNVKPKSSAIERSKTILNNHFRSKSENSDPSVRSSAQLFPPVSQYSKGAQLYRSMLEQSERKLIPMNATLSNHKTICDKEIAKAKTWHVPVQTSMTSSNHVQTDRRQLHMSNAHPTQDSYITPSVIPSQRHPVPIAPMYVKHTDIRMSNNVLSSSQNSDNHINYSQRKITLKYLEDQRKLVSSNIKREQTAFPSNPLQPQRFNPGTDIYRDAFKIPYSEPHYRHLLPTSQKPATMQLPVKSYLQTPNISQQSQVHRFGHEKIGLYNMETKPNETPMESSRPTFEQYQVQHLQSTISDQRRPLGTSALQNQSPVPASPNVSSDQKLPMAALLLMMKVN